MINLTLLRPCLLAALLAVAQLASALHDLEHLDADHADGEAACELCLSTASASVGALAAPPTGVAMEVVSVSVVVPSPPRLRITYHRPPMRGPPFNQIVI